jgi:putative transposase
LPFHVLNRAVGRRTIFESDADYAEFIDVVAEALRTRPMRICSYCVMPNHWHMVLWPEHEFGGWHRFPAERRRAAPA